MRSSSGPSGALLRQLAVLPLMLALGATAAATAGEPGSYTVTGTVRDVTGAVVAGAAVTLDVRGRPTVSVHTDETGAFVFTGVPPGVHVLSVAREGFATEAVSVDPSTMREPLVIELRLADLSELVVVTGTRVDRAVHDVPYSISVVDEARIAVSGADSPAELLRDVPGVQLTDTSLAGGKRVRIRGEVGSNVLVLVDGREISEQRSFHGGAPLLLDLFDIDRVEVVRGPSSVVYGSKAIGGTVNFISRPPVRERFAARTSVTLNSSTRGYDAGLALSGTLDWFDYRVSASRSDHGDRRVPDRVDDNRAYSGARGRLENSAFDSGYFTGEIGRRWGDSRLSFRAEQFLSSVQSHTSNDVLAGGLAGFQLDLPRHDRRALVAAYRGVDLVPRLTAVNITAYHQRRDRGFTQTLAVRQPGFAGPGSLLAVDVSLETGFVQRATGLLGNLEWLPATGHRVVAGLDVVHDAMDATVTDTRVTTVTLPRAPVPSVTTRIEQPRTRSRQIAVGAFVQEEWTVRPRWRLIAGLRYNHFDSALESTTNSRLPRGSTERGRWSSTAGLLFRPSPASAWRLTYAQGYRHPSLLEMYEGTAHGDGGLLYPNPALRPETSDHVEVGARVDGPRHHLDVALFHARARDYVTTRFCDPAASCPPMAVVGVDRIYDNVDGASTHGLELSASWTVPGAPLELFTEGSWLHRRFRTVALSTTDTGLPRLWGRGGVRVRPAAGRGRDPFAELAVRAAGAARERTATATVRHPGWAVASVRAGLTLDRRPTPTRLIVEIGNVFDQAYRPALESLHQPGRHVIVKLVSGF